MQLDSFEIELGSPLCKKLAPAEESRLEDLTLQCTALTQELSKMSSDRAEVCHAQYSLIPLDGSNQKYLGD